MYSKFCFQLYDSGNVVLNRCISVILANDQLDRCIFLSAINTSSPKRKLRVSVMMMDKCSPIHICQNGVSATLTAFHFRLLPMSPSFLIEHINKFEWAVQFGKGFSAGASKSLMSWLRAVTVWSFMTYSVSVKYVYKVSLLKQYFLVIVFKCYFVIFTIAFTTPFIHRLTGRLKFQLIFKDQVLFWFGKFSRSIW